MPRPFLLLLLSTATFGVPPPASAQAAKPRREYPGAKGPIRNLAFSRDGKFVAAGVFADEVRVWDVANGKLTQVLSSGAGASIAAAFAPDGKGIVTASLSNATLTVWDLPKGKKRLTLSRGPGPGIHHVAFSLDGKRIASAGAELCVWDARTGKLLSSQAIRVGVCTVAFSPDARIATRRGKSWWRRSVGSRKIYSTPGEWRCHISILRAERRKSMRSDEAPPRHAKKRKP